METEWVVVTTDNGVFMNNKIFVKESAAVDYMTQMAEIYPGYEYEMREVPAKRPKDETDDNT
jgi:hypothetical protein